MSFLESKDGSGIQPITPLDRIRHHLLDGGPIDYDQSLMLDKYRATLSYMCHRGQLNSPGRAIKFVQKTYDLSYSHSAKVVRDTMKLWGDVFKYSREGLQYLHYERFLNLANQARKAEDYKAAVRAEEKACQLLDLFNARAENLDIKNLFQFNVTFTTNPDVLKKGHIEDISHEESE